MGGSFDALAAVIFDMDGVLVDSEPLQEEVLGEFLRLRRRSMTRDDYAATIGLSHQAFWATTIDLLGLDETIENCIRDHEALLLPRLSGLSATPGARELVTGLAARGVPLAVASSSFRPVVDATLRAIGLIDEFGAVVSGEEVRNGKPDPEIFLLAARRLAVAPVSCVAVEDSPHGVRAAIAAGMACLGVVTAYSTPDQLQATRIVASLAQVAPSDMADLVARAPAQGRPEPGSF
jgi:HAD superfamily hydrolase (TIGR01509 family)